MKKKVKHFVFYLLLAIISICLFLLIIFNFYGLITGRSLFPLISLTDILSRAFIGGAMPSIAISSPQNTTYNFGIGDSYSIGLNVSSANIDVDRWWYSLYDLRHNSLAENRTIFVPNATINAVRWSNRLEAYANDSSGNTYNQNVTFFVSVPNSAPLIQNLATEHFACEDGVFSYVFNASDNDEDNLTASISPTGSFFVSSLMGGINLTWRSSEIFSGTLGKSKVGLHKEVVSVSDGNLSDSRNINISVIEINHAPSISAIGAQSVSVYRGNNTFYYEVQASDLEDGNSGSGNLSFNLTFLNGAAFFNISSYGIINASVNSGLLGVYNLSLCISDRGLSAPHANISFCGVNGSSLKTCINFSLTVTEENMAPEITSYYPTSLSFSANGTDSIRFNITKNDPDGGIPDAYWYVDNILIERDIGSSFDEFSYSFGCGVSGAHIVKAVASDGLLSDFIQWNVNVGLVSCAPAAVPGAGGGGGGGAGILPSLVCKPKWGCFAWGTCEKASSALKIGALSEAEYYMKVKGFCSENNLSDEYCGFQRRACDDVNYCNSTLEEPEKVQGCKYVFIPSCSDSVKNCHDDDCEILIDCGGPCPACPTCSDDIQNQDEEDIDCGGPCPMKCPQKGPVYTPYYNFFLIFLFIILGIVALAIAIKVYRGMRKLKKEELSYKR